MTAFAQNFNTYPGDAISPVFTVQDQNGAPVNIASASNIIWTALRAVGTAPVLTKTKQAGQIVLIAGGTTGQFQLNLTGADTTPLTGVYLHQAQVIDAFSNQITVTLGQVTIGRSPSWTFDATQLGAVIGAGNPLMQVRDLIGDTSINDQQLWDEQINFALAQRGYIPGSPSSGVIYAAAATCCRTLAAKYARQVDVVQGELKTNHSARSKHYLDLAIVYQREAQARSLGTVYAGGISVSDKQAQDLNNDRVAPSFTLGMTDNLRGSPRGPQTPETTGNSGSDQLPDF